MTTGGAHTHKGLGRGEGRLLFFPSGGRWTLRGVYALSLVCEAHPTLGGVSLGEAGLEWVPAAPPAAASPVAALQPEPAEAEPPEEPVRVAVSAWAPDLAADWKLLPARKDVDDALPLSDAYHRGPATVPCVACRGPVRLLGELVDVLGRLGHTVLETAEFRRARGSTAHTRGKRNQLVGAETARRLTAAVLQH